MLSKIKDYATKYTTAVKEGALFILSGGELGKSVDISPNDMLASIPEQVLYTITMNLSQSINGPNGVVIYSPSNLLDPDYAIIPMQVPISVATANLWIGASGQAGALQRPLDNTTNGAGFWPLAVNYQKSLSIAQNYDRGVVISSMYTADPLLVSAGSTNLQGQHTIVSVSTQPLSSQLNTAGLFGFCAQSGGSFKNVPINNSVKGGQWGAKDKKYFSGQSVYADNQPALINVNYALTPSTTNMTALITSGFRLLNYFDLPLPFYYGKIEFDIDMRATINRAVGLVNAGAANDLSFTATLNCFWAYVDSAGALQVVSDSLDYEYNTVSASVVNGAYALTGQSCWSGAFSGVRTSKGLLSNQPLFFLGTTLSLFAPGQETGAVGLSATTFNSFLINCSFRVHDLTMDQPQDAIWHLVTNYDGPMELNRVANFRVVPNNASAQLMQQQLEPPMGDEVSSLVCAVASAVYGRTTGMVGTRQEVDNYLARLTRDPLSFLKVAVSHPNGNLLAATTAPQISDEELHEIVEEHPQFQAASKLKIVNRLGKGIARGLRALPNTIAQVGRSINAVESIMNPTSGFAADYHVPSHTGYYAGDMGPMSFKSGGRFESGGRFGSSGRFESSSYPSGRHREPNLEAVGDYPSFMAPLYLPDEQDGLSPEVRELRETLAREREQRRRERAARVEQRRFLGQRESILSSQLRNAHTFQTRTNLARFDMAAREPVVSLNHLSETCKYMGKYHPVSALEGDVETIRSGIRFRTPEAENALRRVTENHLISHHHFTASSSSSAMSELAGYGNDFVEDAINDSAEADEENDNSDDALGGDIETEFDHDPTGPEPRMNGAGRNYYSTAHPYQGKPALEDFLETGRISTEISAADDPFGYSMGRHFWKTPPVDTLKAVSGGGWVLDNEIGNSAKFIAVAEEGSKMVSVVIDLIVTPFKMYTNDSDYHSKLSFAEQILTKSRSGVEEEREQAKDLSVLQRSLGEVEIYFDKKFRFDLNQQESVGETIQASPTFKRSPVKKWYVTASPNLTFTNPGAISGNSFNFALWSALNGFPCGPVLTGEIKDFTLRGVGDLLAKMRGALAYGAPCFLFSATEGDLDELEKIETPIYKGMSPADLMDLGIMGMGCGGFNSQFPLIAHVSKPFELNNLFTLGWRALTRDPIVLDHSRVSDIRSAKFRAALQLVARKKGKLGASCLRDASASQTQAKEIIERINSLIESNTAQLKVIARGPKTEADAKREREITTDLQVFRSVLIILDANADIKQTLPETKSTNVSDDKWRRDLEAYKEKKKQLAEFKKSRQSGWSLVYLDGTPTGDVNVDGAIRAGRKLRGQTFTYDVNKMEVDGKTVYKPVELFWPEYVQIEVKGKKKKKASAGNAADILQSILESARSGGSSSSGK